MAREWRQKLISLVEKEKLTLIGALFLTIVVGLWLFHKPETATRDGAGEELGLSIPKGFLMVPLELSNGTALAGLISHQGVLNVFRPRQKEPLVENLRVLKLESGSEVLFGALVPNHLAGTLQDVFGETKLTGAMGTLESGTTRFHLGVKNRGPSVVEVSIEEGP